MRRIWYRFWKKSIPRRGVIFVFVIDEWDCIFRVNPMDAQAQKKVSQFSQGFAEKISLTVCLPT